MEENHISSLSQAKPAVKENRRIKIKSFFKNKTAVVGLVISVIMVAAAILASVIFPEGPFGMDTMIRLQKPSAAHLWGTDEFGRDVLCRTLYGIRISLLIGLSTAVITFVIGMILGVLSAYYHMLDNIIMRICEAMMSIPSILMGIALMSALGASSVNVVIALSIVYTPVVARIARASALSVKEMTYIEAIRSQGAGPMRILFRHIAPNCLSPVIVQATYVFATSIIVEASLSFLGAGVPVPSPSLGNILNEAKQYIFQSWWMVTFPSIVMIFLVVGINLLGDGVRDVLDPSSN